MFSRLTRKQRWRVASLLVALYTLCLAAPTTVLALGQGPFPAHCLTGDHDSLVAHVHDAGTIDHRSGGKADDGHHEGKCCGLFGVTAIASEVGAIVTPLTPASRQSSIAVANLTGRNSDRIDRPPRSPLSL